jgi:hypothetical protein
MCRIHDAEPCEYYRAKNVTARKNHQCMECDRTIARGETYHRATMLFDDRWDTCKLCAHCEAVAEWLSVVCGGYLYGGIGEELIEHWDEEPELRSMGLARAIYGRERGWRSKFGRGLLPIPYEAKLAAQLTMGPTQERERIGREVYDVKFRVADELRRARQRAAA